MPRTAVWVTHRLAYAFGYKQFYESLSVEIADDNERGKDQSSASKFFRGNYRVNHNCITDRKKNWYPLDKRGINPMKFSVFCVLAALTVSFSGFSGVPLGTSLNGDEEVPGPGDTDGEGFVVLALKPALKKICYLLSVENIDTPTAAHIHKAPVGEAGPVVVALEPPEDGDSHGCVSDVERNLIIDIIRNPSDYYINVHNAEFPAGAIRGQLGFDE